MNNPFEVLGLKGWAGPDEIRTAYRALARQCHPDMIQDPAEKEAAQTRMVALNLAYEEALRLASPRTGANTVTPELSCAESILMAQRAMARNNPQGALRSLIRCGKRDGDWYYMQGKVLMALEEFDSAHQSFREAVRMPWPPRWRCRRSRNCRGRSERCSKTYSGNNPEKDEYSAAGYPRG